VTRDGAAVVVGAGPNGLAAGIVVAAAGRPVVLLEAADTVGGGTRTAALTRPGFLHDVCAAIHPMVPGSPFLRALPLAAHGLELVHPSAPLAHPLDDGTAVLLERSVTATAEGLGPDGAAYHALLAPLVGGWAALAEGVLGPLRLPRHPLLLARFGLAALRSTTALARRFRGVRAPALLAGLAAHSMLPLDRMPSAAIGLVLAVLGHACGWPLARGGSQRIADALAGHLRALGGTIVTGRRVASLAELPPAPLVLLDVTPRQVVRIAAERLPAGYRRRLARFRYGPGAFKVDWALDAPIPWRAPACARAATVHVGGPLEEIAAAEAAVAGGAIPQRPFVLVAQPTLFDPSRAPAGRHTAWAYCHVPHASAVDMTDRIEAQIERFAPGFRDRIVARHTMAPPDLERYNANYVGGDINGGLQDLRQLFTRPVARLVPYATPVRGLYLCSSSTPPGGGVHGMCGYWAARAALRSRRTARPA
jgi:phytoene dehydrogenase-like protein